VAQYASALYAIAVQRNRFDYHNRDVVDGPYDWSFSIGARNNPPGAYVGARSKCAGPPADCRDHRECSHLQWHFGPAFCAVKHLGRGKRNQDDIPMVYASAGAKDATADNAQLLALSGKRSPYAGTLGVVAEGALADMLLVDGDPLADIQLIANPAKNFVVIMKDGKIYKNTLR